MLHAKFHEVILKNVEMIEKKSLQIGQKTSFEKNEVKVSEVFRTIYLTKTSTFFMFYG